MHGVYFNTHGTYRGQICGRIIASEVQNNGYLQARYFNIPVNLVGSTRVFFCILPTRIYILILHFCKHCCSQHVWGSHLCSCRNTWTTATKIEILTKEESSGEHEIWCTGEPKRRTAKQLKHWWLCFLHFFSSFTPACGMIYLLNFCSGCSCALIHWLRDLQFLIVLCNSGINPYLYAWRLPQFKRAFYKFLHLKARTKFSDIATTSIHATGKRETSQIPETLSGEDERISFV